MPNESAPAGGAQSVPAAGETLPDAFIEATVAVVSEWEEYWLRRTAETPDDPAVIEFWRIIQSLPSRQAAA